MLRTLLLVCFSFIAGYLFAHNEKETKTEKRKCIERAVTDAMTKANRHSKVNNVGK